MTRTFIVKGEEITVSYDIDTKLYTVPADIFAELIKAYKESKEGK